MPFTSTLAWYLQTRLEPIIKVESFKGYTLVVALPPNIGLDRKWMVVENTLAYYDVATITLKRFTLQLLTLQSRKWQFADHFVTFNAGIVV